MILTELRAAPAARAGMPGHSGTEARFDAFFDTGAHLRLTAALVADFSLCSGREMDEREFAALCAAVDRSRCRSRALRAIGYRAMSTRELCQKLVEKGETEANAAEAVAWLLDMHLLDDEAYAAMTVRHYAAKGYGVRRIRDELYRRSVPKELWDGALAQLEESDGTLDRLLRARLRSPHPDRAERKRAADALLRRGFAWSEIREALARYDEEMQNESDDGDEAYYADLPDDAP